MAEILFIAERRLSGTGLIIPDPTDLIHRRYTLFADIIRKPKTPYLSRDSEPPKTYYGVINLMKNGYVTQTFKIEYDAQMWNFDADISGQTLIAVKCAYLGTLETFLNLGVKLNLQPFVVDNTIANYKNLPLEWDSIIVKCFADCAIQFVLKAIPYDSCSQDYLNTQDSAIPPVKPQIVDPGIATSISPAYPGDTITSPAAIDLTFVPPPLGNACQAYVLSLTLLVSTSSNPGFMINRSTNVYGPVSLDFRTKEGQPNVLQAQHRGNPQIQGCQPLAYRDIVSLGSGENIISWSNVTIT